jgi:hypothetical protein
MPKFTLERYETVAKPLGRADDLQRLFGVSPEALLSNREQHLLRDDKPDVEL